jgi:hypothetical protein
MAAIRVAWIRREFETLASEAGRLVANLRVSCRGFANLRRSDVALIQHDWRADAGREAAASCRLRPITTWTAMQKFSALSLLRMTSSSSVVGPRACNGLLPRQPLRHHQCRGSRKGLARRRQYRPQHHDHPLELSLRRERRHLRARPQAVGRAQPGTQLQRHVFTTRRLDAGAQMCTMCRASSDTSMPTG